jgi:hypothetical protein
VRPSRLDRFDVVVADLNRWEELRYGGFPVGFSTTIVFLRRRGPRKTRSVEPQDKYVLVLEDVDELFTEMVTACRINPTFLGERHRLKPDMREWYAKDNLQVRSSSRKLTSDYDLIVVSELRLVELPAGSMADLGFRCPPVTVVVRVARLACGPRAARVGADAFGAPVLRDQGPIGRPGTARPIPSSEPQVAWHAG